MAKSAHPRASAGGILAKVNKIGRCSGMINYLKGHFPRVAIILIGFNVPSINLTTRPGRGFQW